MDLILLLFILYNYELGTIRNLVPMDLDIIQFMIFPYNYNI